MERNILPLTYRKTLVYAEKFPHFLEKIFLIGLSIESEQKTGTVDPVHLFQTTQS